MPPAREHEPPAVGRHDHRQLNKLEQAISEVESEHAEALPPVEETEALEPDTLEAPPGEEAATPVTQQAEPEALPAASVEAEQTAQRRSKSLLRTPPRKSPKVRCKRPPMRSRPHRLPRHPRSTCAKRHRFRRGAGRRCRRRFRKRDEPAEEQHRPRSRCASRNILPKT